MASINYSGVHSIRKAMFISGLVFLFSGCASNEKLFAEYDQHFCAASDAGSPIVIEKIVEKEVVNEKVIVKEVPASLKHLRWEPAVYFDSNCTKLGGASIGTLQRNIKFLKRFPLYNVSVRGFTDQHASVDYNRKLSERRTEKVIQYFIEQGIVRSRLVVHAHGESLALSESSTPIADEISRRVEMILLDQNGRPAVAYQSVAGEE